MPKANAPTGKARHLTNKNFRTSNQVPSNKDASKERNKVFFFFNLKICFFNYKGTGFVSYLDRDSIISMQFLIKIRDSKKKRATDGPRTDGHTFI